jgi:predicted ABC-type ATPase
MAGEFDVLAHRLDAIADELTELAMARLRDSIDAGGHELPVDEKRLNRARRSVERAAAILRSPDHTEVL